MEIIRPDNLQDALRFLSEGRRPAAGCTNILVDLKKKGEPGFDYVDVSGLLELRGIREELGAVTLGALTTFAEIEDYFTGKPGLEALADAAAQMGSPQVRNRATIGGNIADASPACDAGPGLLAMNAAVKAVSVRGEQVIPMAEFFKGVRETALVPDELICSITIPAAPVKSAWRKVGLRNASAISVVSLAACSGADGKTALAMGSVAPRPVRLCHCEYYLETGRTTKAELQEALRADISPISDIRAEADYRRTVAENLLLDTLGKEFGYEIG